MFLENLLHAWPAKVLAILRIVTGFVFLQHGSIKLLRFPCDVHYAGTPIAKYLTVFPLLIASTLPALAETCSSGAADTLLVSGKILTVDSQDRVVQALALRDNRIVAVGTDSEILRHECHGSTIIDLGGRTVIPGMTDAHIHAIRGGQSFRFESHWDDVTSLASALGVLSSAAAKRPANQWVIVGGGWHPEQFAEKRAPTAAELTHAVPDHPAIVQFQYEWALLNQRGIDVLDLAQPSPGLPAGVTAERDESGAPTGRLRGGIGPLSLLMSRLADIDREERKASLSEFLRLLSSFGVTGVIDAAGGGSGASTYDPVFALWREHRLPVRVAYRVSAQSAQNEPEWYKQTLAYLAPQLGDDMLHFAGLGEIVVFGMNDGTRLTSGFTPSAESQQRLYEIASWAAERGYMLEIHAYTDDAANRILDVLERIAPLYPLQDLRWSITHVSTGTHATFARMKALGLAYNVQLNLYFGAPQLSESIGADRARLSPPTRVALDAGLRVAGGTDATRVAPFNTMLALQFQIDGRSVASSVERRPDLGIGRMEALRMYTLNSAWLAGDDDKRGSLEVGKLADLAVLDRDFLDVPVEQIGRIRSVLTIMDGKFVHAEGPFKALVPQ